LLIFVDEQQYGLILRIDNQELFPIIVEKYATIEAEIIEKMLLPSIIARQNWYYLNFAVIIYLRMLKEMATRISGSEVFMDIATRLDLFLDVVKQGSFTRAAEMRLMDRSSLSKQIKILERELGIRLLNRSTRSLSLTEAGKEVIIQAESVRRTISDTRRIVESFQGEPKGLLRLTCPTLFGKLYLQKTIMIFMEKYPDTYRRNVLTCGTLRVN